MLLKMQHSVRLICRSPSQVYLLILPGINLLKREVLTLKTRQCPIFLDYPQTSPSSTE